MHQAGNLRRLVRMPTHRTRLYLVVPSHAGIDPKALEAALAAGDVACLLIAKGKGATIDAGRASAIVKIAQPLGVAALIEDDPALAARLGADGVHIGPRGSPEAALAAMTEARKTLGGQSIVGASAGLSRHTAMQLGEAGADYVAFEGGTGADDKEAQHSLIAWWSELIEVPGVALSVSTAAEAAGLARLGADFIAVELGGSETPGGMPSQRVAEFDAALHTEPVPPA